MPNFTDEKTETYKGQVTCSHLPIQCLQPGTELVSQTLQLDHI